MMKYRELDKYLSQIKDLDCDAVRKAEKRLGSLAKPPESLGKLEDIAVQLSGISGELFNDVSKRTLIIMCSDNGVFEEGIAATPQSVTYSQAVNSTKGRTGAGVIAKQFGADVMVVDVGINADVSNPNIINRKIRKSTWNIFKGAAMTHDEAVKAIISGIEIAEECVNNGSKLLGVGELGIGNTTTAAAVLSGLTGIEPVKVVGKGAGLKEDAYLNKIKVVETAIALNKPDKNDPVDVIAKVGGFDIAAMTGVYIGAAYMRVPVVIDGYISIVAALAAVRLNPNIRNFMIPSHASFEIGYMRAADEIGLSPSLNLNMRLGEGSGCPIMFSVIDAACAIIKNMATFEEAEINDDYIDEIKDRSNFTIPMQG